MEKHLLKTDLNSLRFDEFLESNTDVSDIKRAEAAIRESEEKYRKIVTSAQEGIWVTDRKGKINFVNETMADWIGHSVEEIINRNASDFIESEGIEESTLHWYDRETGISEKNDFKLRKKDGSCIWLIVSGSPLYDSCGNHTGNLSMFMDITARKEAERKLAFQADLLSCVNDAITAADENFIIIYWNRIAEKMFGWGASEVLGKHFKEVFQTIAADFSYDEELEKMSCTDCYEGEIHFRHKDGTYIITDVHSNVLKDSEGRFKGTVTSFRDITVRKKLQAELRSQQEKMLQTEKEKIEALKKSIEMKDEFLSLVSHEFKTPLTVINSAVQTMRLVCRSELTPKGNEFLNKILQNSNRQLKLVNNLLDITRISAGHLKISKTNIDIVFLTKSITESIQVFAEQKEIKLFFSSTMADKVIGVDEEKYERILLNLLSNAVKFTPKGKSITVKVVQRIVKGKRKVCIRVIDQGIGIPPDRQELIFERFGQVDSSLSRQAEGTGIGLFLVKMLVENLGGEITLKSEVGIGSTFTVILPIEKVKETPIEKMIQEISNSRLIEAKAIEFSDIYMQ